MGDMKKALIVVAVTATLLSGCSTAAEPGAASIGSSGTVTVPSGAHKQYEGTDCEGFRGISDAKVDGFKDISAGTQVVVTDASGTVVGTSTLGGGTLIRASDWSEQSIRGLACSYTFTFTDLPDGTFYGIHVGDSTRGDVQFSKAEMQAGPTITID